MDPASEQDKPTQLWMPATIRPPGAQGEVRLTEYYYCDNFPGRGPLVVLLAKRSWPLAMRLHHGILRPAFYVRASTDDEPDRAVGGIPWNWAYRIDQLFLDEHRLRTPQELAELRAALARELAAVGASALAGEKEPVH